MGYDARRWSLLCICILINICIGVGYAWSVFQKPLAEHFGWPAAEVSLAFTIVMGISALPQFLAGKAQEYTEPRNVILAGGVLLGGGVLGIGYIQSLAHLYAGSAAAGLGIGVVYSGTVANMVRFFPDRRGLASGALAAGMGSGAIFLAPLASFLTLQFGILTTFKILGCLFLAVVCGLSRLVTTVPADYRPKGYTPQNGQTAGGVDRNWREMLKERLFYLLAAIFVIGGTSGMMVMGHASPILQETLKISAQSAAAIVGLLAVSNAAGRILWGSLSDKCGRYPVMFGLYIISGVAMVLLTRVVAPHPFVAAMMTVALCYGGFMGMMASLTADAFGARYLGVNFGIMFLTVGIAAFIGPRLAAVVREVHQGDYSQAFLIAAALDMIGLLLVTLASRRTMNKRAGFQKDG